MGGFFLKSDKLPIAHCICFRASSEIHGHLSSSDAFVSVHSRIWNFLSQHKAGKRAISSSSHDGRLSSCDSFVTDNPRLWNSMSQHKLGTRAFKSSLHEAYGYHHLQPWFKQEK